MTAARASDNEELAKEVLWIHVPDWTLNGVVSDIKNVTNRVTDYSTLWQSLDKLDDRYELMFIDPIQEVLIEHRDQYEDALDSLSVDEKIAFAALVSNLNNINPFDQDKIVNLLEAGLA